MIKVMKEFIDKNIGIYTYNIDCVPVRETFTLHSNGNTNPILNYSYVVDVWSDGWREYKRMDHAQISPADAGFARNDLVGFGATNLEKLAFAQSWESANLDESFTCSGVINAIHRTNGR